MQPLYFSLLPTSTASSLTLGSTSWQWTNLGQPNGAQPAVGVGTTTAGGYFNALVLDAPGNLWTCWLDGSGWQ
ncbi:hypothetical protein [Hymenobacter cheonanensis]|uniref:hypothetical protein n=1 Tax=Hymenobacter sp. CA2-7 TaxID=3063993 RepID=UPI0027141712|nr:hypothetical protein [Hymenobacter sp. CA2-7]MDO7885715.1 hypothetical protein [Hymenobacter sp. CA2-7]